MEERLKLLVKSFGEERFKFNENLSKHTHSKLGGAAEVFFIATTSRELIRILELASELKINFTIFGSGTKILFAKEKIKGLIIKNRTSSLKITGVKGKVGREGLGVEEALVEIDSGVTLLKLNEFLKKQNLETISGFSSHQSTLGGAIFLDPELRSRTQSVKIWDNGEEVILPVTSLRMIDHIVLSATVKFRSKN